LQRIKKGISANVIKLRQIEERESRNNLTLFFSFEKNQEKCIKRVDKNQKIARSVSLRASFGK